MLTLSRVGGSKNIQNAYGCLCCHVWVDPKTQILTDVYAVGDDGSEIFKRVMMFIKPKSVKPIFENWRKKSHKNTFLNTIDLVGIRKLSKTWNLDM